MNQKIVNRGFTSTHNICVLVDNFKAAIDYDNLNMDKRRIVDKYCYDNATSCVNIDNARNGVTHLLSYYFPDVMVSLDILEKELEL